MKTPSRQFPLGHDLRRVGNRSDLEPADVGAFDLALTDVEDESDPTEVVSGAVIERRVTGADEVAGAGLDVAPFDVPGHPQPPYDGESIL
jgi:hypothetical protein